MTPSPLGEGWGEGLSANCNLNVAAGFSPQSVQEFRSIIGVEELMVNENEAFTNELGRTARSKAQDGLVPGDTLGALHLRDLYTQVEFRCGMFKGFSANYKKQLWDNRDKIMGKIFKYSHFPIGAKDKPRHPKGLGFRDKIDL